MNLGVSHASIRSSRIPLTEAADWFTAAWIFRAQFGNPVSAIWTGLFPISRRSCSAFPISGRSKVYIGRVNTVKRYSRQPAGSEQEAEKQKTGKNREKNRKIGGQGYAAAYSRDPSEQLHAYLAKT